MGRNGCRGEGTGDWRGEAPEGGWDLGCTGGPAMVGCGSPTSPLMSALGQGVGVGGGAHDVGSLEKKQGTGTAEKVPVLATSLRPRSRPTAHPRLPAPTSWSQLTPAVTGSLLEIRAQAAPSPLGLWLGPRRSVATSPALISHPSRAWHQSWGTGQRQGGRQWLKLVLDATRVG